MLTAGVDSGEIGSEARLSAVATPDNDFRFFLLIVRSSMLAAGVDSSDIASFVADISLSFCLLFVDFLSCSAADWPTAGACGASSPLAAYQ
jgi:hypothetical protein